MDAYTSGFEGPWTKFPTEWGNSYFHMLLNHEYGPVVGPGNHTQWAVVGADPQAPAADGNGTQSVMMLTSDLALLADPAYHALVTLYANDLPALEFAFKHAWYARAQQERGGSSGRKGSVAQSQLQLKHVFSKTKNKRYSALFLPNFPSNFNIPTDVILITET